LATPSGTFVAAFVATFVARADFSFQLSEFQLFP
jgi:hypothetical protein